MNRWRTISILPLAAILAYALTVRLYQLDAPLADHLQAKQVYSANKARQIAKPPFNPGRLTLDLLDDDGHPMALVEEVPLYITALAAFNRVLGERELWGRFLSITGTLIAITAFFALVRREFGARLASVSSLLMAASPLLIFYGRAVLPDPWMLAAMLVAAYSYRRYLDDPRRPWRWLLAAAGSAILAVAFKYWGLMILVVFTAMAAKASRQNQRDWLSPRFFFLIISVLVPVALWMTLVFFRARNPVTQGWVAGQTEATPYLVFQQPAVLLDKRWYAALVRFVWRDCGPLATPLIALGILASRRSGIGSPTDRGSLAGWSLMGGLFFILLAPKLVDHDYYELILLPAACLWAGLGWQAIARNANAIHHAQGQLLWRRRVAYLVLLLALVIHSPLVFSSFFRQETGKLALGHSLQSASKPGDRIVAIGPGISLITVVHYSGRQGWAVRVPELPADWENQVERWRSQGARLLAIYFDSKTPSTQKRSFTPLIQSLPVAARRTGPIDPKTKDHSYDYVILSLEGSRVAGRASSVSDRSSIRFE